MSHYLEISQFTRDVECRFGHQFHIDSTRENGHTYTYGCLCPDCGLPSIDQEIEYSGTCQGSRERLQLSLMLKRYRNSLRLFKIVSTSRALVPQMEAVREQIRAIYE